MTTQIPSLLFRYFSPNSKYSTTENPALFSVYPPSTYINQEYVYYCNIINNKRMFGIRTIRSMFEYILSLQPRERNVFELCPTEWYRKIYFDIDISNDKLEYSQGEFIISALITAIKDSIYECLSDNSESDTEIELPDDICYITQSHTSIKKSYHIVVSDYAFKSHIEVKEFYKLVINKLPKTLTTDENGKLKTIIDPKVYSSNQNFRLLYCTKPGREAYKIVPGVPKLDELDISYVKKLSNEQLENIPQYSLFKRLLLTYVPGETFILDIPEKYKTNIPEIKIENHIYDTSLLDAYNSWSKNNVELANQYDIPDIHSCDRKYNIIRLDRNQPGYCVMCDRIHNKDNAYLTINSTGNICYNCYRNEEVYTEFNRDQNATWSNVITYIINKIFEPEEFKNLPNKLKSVIAIIHEGEGDVLTEVVLKKNNKLVTKPLVQFVRECNVFTITERYYKNKNPPESAIRKHKLGAYIVSICSSISYLSSEFMPYSPNDPNKFYKPGVLNLFPGFKAIPIPKSDYNFDKFVKPWLDHIHIILCNNDETVFNNVIGFRAHLIQRPYEKPAVAHLFQSEKGAGKNTELDFFAKYVVGLELAVIIDNIEAVTGEFNIITKHRLFIVLDETKANKGDKDKLKSFLTQVHYLINPKGKDMYQAINLARTTMSSNAEGPLLIVEDGSRRFLAQRCNNKYSAEKRRQDPQVNAEARKYFNNLHRNVLTEEGARHVIRYLMEYDLESSEFDPYDVPPTTQYLKELEAYSEPPPITFLKEWDWTRLLANGDRSKITLPCKMKDIVHEFLIWIKERTTFVSNHYKTTRGFEITVIKDKYSHLIEKTNRKYQNAYLYTNISLEGEQNLKIDLTGIQH